MCVELLDAAGGLSGLWSTVRLPILAPLVSRASECPPRLPLRLFDPDAPEASDISSPQPGPCPKARSRLQAILRSAHRVVVHLPIEASTLLDLAASRTVPGDLYVLQTQGYQNNQDSLASCPTSNLGSRVSGLLIAAGIAQPLSPERQYGPTG